MSFDCWPPREETTEERIKRLNGEIAKEQEIVNKREAEKLERQLADLRRSNKPDYDDRF